MGFTEFDDDGELPWLLAHVNRHGGGFSEI